MTGQQMTGPCGGVREVFGYLSSFSARPGETLAVHLSSREPAKAALSVERVICGDADRGYRAEATTAFGHPNAIDLSPQTIRSGSCLIVDNFSVRNDTGPCTISVEVRPTLDREAVLIDFGSAGRIVRQADGRLLLEMGTVREQSSLRLHVGRWANLGIGIGSDGRISWVAVEAARHGVLNTAGGSADRLVFAAALDEHFRPLRAFDGSMETFRALTGNGMCLLDLDVAGDPGSAVVRNRSGAFLSGRLVNAPTRAVPGRAWNGSGLSPREMPDHYGAIHFHSDDLEDAGWPVSATVEISPTAESGSYCLVVTTGGETVRLPFFVEPKEGADCRPVVFLASTMTYHAYANVRIALENPVYEVSETTAIPVLDDVLVDLQVHPEFGGSHYDLHPDGHPVYMTTRRRPILNFAPNTPIWSYNADTHVTAFLEDAGFEFDVVTDDSLHFRGAEALKGCRVLVTGTHPEYASDATLDAIAAFLATGGRVIYLGANGFYWRVAIPPDRPWLMELRRAESGARYNEPAPGEDYLQTTGQHSGLWRRLGRPPQALFGVGMMGDGWDSCGSYRLTPAARSTRVGFLFEGIDGDVIGEPCEDHPGAAGLELDAADPILGTPDHALVVARSGPHSTAYQLAPEETLFLHPGTGGGLAPKLRADLLFMETKAGGAVLSTGSIAWGAALQRLDRSLTDVGLLTANAVRRFADEKPFVLPQEALDGLE
jgi:hypothetical protein